MMMIMMTVVIRIGSVRIFVVLVIILTFPAVWRPLKVHVGFVRVFVLFSAP